VYSSLALVDTIYAGLAAGMVKGVRRHPQCRAEIAARMSLDEAQLFLGKPGGAGRPTGAIDPFEGQAE
jgi:hypothetical protein